MNKRVLLSTAVSAAILLALGTMPKSAVGQGIKNRPAQAVGKNAEKAGDADSVRIRRFTGVGRQATEKTPEFKSNAPRGIKPSGEWAQIQVVYDTTPEWVDEIVFQFYVISQRVNEEGKKEFSLYKQIVKSSNVEKGRDHMCSVHLRPNILKRYGSVVAAAVEISVGGKIVAEKSEMDPDARSGLPEKWWSEQRVLESKTVVTRDGYLLDRSDTPFALVNIDDYEASK